MEPSIIIKESDLKDKAIDDIINLEKSLVANFSDGQVEEIKTPFYLNPIFYYAVAALIACILVWAITEPFYNDNEASNGGIMSIAFISDYLLFGPIAGFIGLSIGVSYGISNRNWKQAFYCAFIGLGVGMLATVVTNFIASVAFGISTGIATSFVTTPGAGEEYQLHGMSFFIFMCGRGIAWSIVSVGAGAGLGVAMKSKKMLFNGIVGGMIGGLFGGLLFDPIARYIFTESTEAAISRGVGFACIGLCIGLFTGLIENVSKEAWFLMQKGPLMGKQFILFKNPTLIGSSPKCEIYLFKDSAIEPKHATVIRSGNKYVIKDEGTESGLFINGRRVDRALLQAGDIVSIGETILKYSERQKNV